jgi:hypothetical protein
MGQHVNKLNTMVEELEVIESTMLLEVKVMVFLMNFLNFYHHWYVIIILLIYQLTNLGSCYWEII